MVFDPADGSKTERVTVPDGSLASPPADNPKRDGYRFDGWSEHDAMMDFRTPITRDITLKAKWTPVTDWALSPDHGPASGGTSITITPPRADSPSFSALEAHDNKLIGVTGDGRLFTWTSKAEMPVQVPSPQGKPGDVRFVTGIVGHNGFAALSRDHRIYTWSKGEDTPALLDADSTTYTSIDMAADHLVAVNQDGRIRTWTSMGKLTGKAISLPNQASAIKVAGNADRLLAMDSKGKIWAWKPDAVDTAQIQHVKIAHRIVQISATNHGFVLLDSTGQTSYLDNRQTQPELLIMPDHSAVAAISSDATQAALVDSNGLVWVWKPDEAPKRADDGSQQYVRAASIGGEIAAISRQGGMLTWSMDTQGNHGKPVRLDTTAAPILESASLDGQALPLSRSNGSWRAEAPARKPGPAAILITGRQDGQPFARSLAYTVDQPPARAGEPGSAFTVRFDTGGGSPKPADQHVSSPYGRVKRPSPDPVREGFLFDGWFTGDVAYDFSRPVGKDLTLAAHWTPASRNSRWSISPNKGSQLGREPATITPPDNASRGIRFSQVSGSPNTSYGFSLAVGSDGNVYAWGDNYYGQLGIGTTSSYRTTPVMVRRPDRSTYPDLPEDFTYLQVSAGGSHSLALGSDGNAYAWGWNGDGQLGDGTITERHAPVRVKTPDRKTYPDLPADFTYLQVSAGDRHSLALGSDGNVYAWGYNYYGRLGDGTSTTRYAPVRVKTPDRKTYPDLPEDFTYLQVSAGTWHSLALGSDGNAYAWGDNSSGQLGDGTGSDRYAPVRVKTPDRKTYPDLPADFTYLQVSAGYAHSLALGSDGNAYAWGYNNNGPLGDGTGSSRNAPVRVKTPDRKTYPDLPADFTYQQISAGYDHSLAVGSDGNAWAWGCNLYGLLGNNSSYRSSSVPMRVRDPANPADTSKGLQAAQVSAGYHYSLAVGSDGNAWAWGSNSYGRLGDNSTNNKSAPVPVSFNLALVITGVRFDQTPASGLTRGDAGSVTVTTPAHQPGTVTVSVDYTLGGAPQTPDTSLRYTYLPAGVLPQAGGQGILLALATGMTGMGGVLASRRHRREQRRLLHASHE
ncbi:InlB B-repeat-containing protein [Bifidobacterium sp. W8101]|nr:InlB B-repeat-containing protein [Bifidobacterium choladohabitans]MBI0128571.1 InlB B-repeat-containing protein [Bifidobacterium sp. W8103]MBI0139056.1 InlB B-repeat-containing protein [Bifidobacterium sp. W8105]MBI0149420.1 InlB B-repeat-containing protein [Bifidobacterium sp. W8107]